VRSSGYITDFCVVFDGQDKYRSYDRMNVGRGKSQVFSRTGDGDDKIIRTVKEYSSKNRVIVASNDNYVKNMSRGYGASHISVEELVKKKRKSKVQKRVTGKQISGKAKSRITREYKKELGLE
jgi:predicted RNA-binding protein with PIN domain